MCGIAGFIGCGNERLVASMTDVIAHRGPDDAGVMWFADRSVGLGHRRLSILDLSPAGHQPMVNDRGDLWITYNGELYNYRELRQQLVARGYSFRSDSDTEVLLKAFEAWGPACLESFKGMFAFAIYNTRTGDLFAARDQIGVKPFYYSEIPGGLIFASEIKAILRSGLVAARPDYAALCTPARFQVSPLTGFEGIAKLPPGHSLVFHDGKLTLRRYWNVMVSEDPAYDEPRAEEELESLLVEAVRGQMIADVPVGLLLSGGLDSSILGALMRRNTTQDIHAFTIKFSALDQRFEKAIDDSVFARRVAGRFGFVYHEFEVQPDLVDLLPKMVWHLDEPLADPAAINTYLISKAARELGIIVLLNGMGGDEVFGGYRKHLACLRADAYQELLPGSVRRLLEWIAAKVPVASTKQGFRSVRWAKRFLSFAPLPPFERFLTSDLSLSEDQYRRLFVRASDYRKTHFFMSQHERFTGLSASYLTKMCLNDTEVFLPELNLTYADKASMAVGVEGRPPLTDLNVVQFMFSLPPQSRIRRNTQKYLLKKVSERYLPADVVRRPKAPFGSPLRSWIRGPLSPMIDDLLSEESIRARSLYDYRYVHAMIENDRKGLEDNAHLLWTLLTNEIWLRTFFSS